MAACDVTKKSHDAVFPQKCKILSNFAVGSFIDLIQCAKTQQQITIQTDIRIPHNSQIVSGCFLSFNMHKQTHLTLK